VAPRPDVAASLADLDAAEARPDLHGPVATRPECGEPVQITRDPESRRAGPADQRWLQIVDPIQPSRLEARGGPRWVLAADIGDKDPDRQQRASATTASGDEAHALAFIEAAPAHLGISYLWGGMCDAALDWSSLVHLSHRRLGVAVPTDAGDQDNVYKHIPMAGARPGDLIFFARDGMRAGTAHPGARQDRRRSRPAALAAVGQREHRVTRRVPAPALVLAAVVSVQFGAAVAPP
jgi:hypothetical protein